MKIEAGVAIGDPTPLVGDEVAMAKISDVIDNMETTSFAANAYTVGTAGNSIDYTYVPNEAWLAISNTENGYINTDATTYYGYVPSAGDSSKVEPFKLVPPYGMLYAVGAAQEGTVGDFLPFDISAAVLEYEENDDGSGEFTVNQDIGTLKGQEFFGGQYERGAKPSTWKMAISSDGLITSITYDYSLYGNSFVGSEEVDFSYDSVTLPEGFDYTKISDWNGISDVPSDWRETSPDIVFPGLEKYFKNNGDASYEEKALAVPYLYDSVLNDYWTISDSYSFSYGQGVVIVNSYQSSGSDETSFITNFKKQLDADSSFVEVTEEVQYDGTTQYSYENAEGGMYIVFSTLGPTDGIYVYDLA